MNYAAAKKFCQRINSHLVEVETEEAMTYLAAQLREVGAGLHFWGGATVEEDGVWRWSEARTVVRRFVRLREPNPDYDNLKLGFDCNSAEEKCYGFAYLEISDLRPVCQKKLNL